MLIREGKGYRNRGETIKWWYSLETGSWFLLKEICITMSLSFTELEPPPRGGGNFRLKTRFLAHSSVASPPANQKREKKKVTNPAALTPNVASCFWGPVMTILLGLLFGPFLFHL